MAYTMSNLIDNDAEKCTTDIKTAKGFFSESDSINVDNMLKTYEYAVELRNKEIINTNDYNNMINEIKDKYIRKTVKIVTNYSTDYQNATLEEGADEEQLIESVTDAVTNVLSGIVTDAVLCNSNTISTIICYTIHYTLLEIITDID